MKKKKNKKKKRKIEVQNIFIIVSLISLIALGTTIGYKSIYYYSKQNQKIKVESKLLSTIIKKDNLIVTEGDGLYQDGKDYLFKGKVDNNYVSYSNQLFRILRINSDNTVRLISENNQTSLIWGDDINYLNSNLYLWLNQTEQEYSGIFHKLLNLPEKYLAITSWCEDTVVNGQVECKSYDANDLYALLTLQEYVDALGENSFINNNSYTWLNGVDENSEKIVLNKNGKIISAFNYDGYGIRPIITIKNNINVIDGNGTIDNPYKIEEEKTLINSYVKLNEDTYKIIEEKNGILKMSLNSYLTVNNEEYLSVYNYKNNVFDVNDRYNIAYYLNNRYLNSLSYKDNLTDCTFYNGELSDEIGYSYLNLYQKPLTLKVGILNTIDLKSNNGLTDYYLMDKTSDFSEMAYVYQSDGKMKESLTNEKKKIVPVVCITKEKLVNGSGSIDEPYVME